MGIKRTIGVSKVIIECIDKRNGNKKKNTSLYYTFSFEVSVAMLRSSYFGGDIVTRVNIFRR
jgi:hypothetical protein